MKSKEVSSLLRNVLQCLIFSFIFLSFGTTIQADPIQSSISIDFLSEQAGQEEINILQTNAGLMSHRRNLDAIYISHAFEIPIKDAYPFLTFTPVGELDNYREEGFEFHVRFSADARQWTSWEKVPLYHELEPDDPRYIGEMKYLDSTQRYFEFMVYLTNDEITLPPVRLRNLKLDFFNPNTPRIPEFQKNGGLETAKPSGNTLFEDTWCDCAQPEFSDRASWNCPDGNNFSGSGAPAYTKVTHIIVHHSAGPNSSSDYGASVLSIWNLHKNTNGWDDIGYNWLIDPHGVIYEGRGGGNNVRGAHFCGKNSGTMGICFLGNFESATPTPAALASLEALAAWKSCDAQLKPAGTSLHESSEKNLSVISGHQDGCNTLCPGANLYPKIASQVRSNADSILQACSAVTSVLDEELISDLNMYPNPTSGWVNLDWTAQQTGDVKLEILNYQGQLFLQRDLKVFVGPQQMQFNLPKLQAGIYLVRFRHKKGTLTRKLILR